VIHGGGGKGKGLGEGFSSPGEETFNMPGERGTVKNTSPDPKEPMRPNPRFPDEVRNPFGQMLQDMEEQKKNQRELDKEHRMYKKHEYYAVSEHEEDAVKEAVAAGQAMLVSDYPDKEAEDEAQSANDDLLKAEKARRTAEAEGHSEYKFSFNKPVPDQPDPLGTGIFSQMYAYSKQMGDSEAAAQDMNAAFATKPLPAKIRRELYPDKNNRQKARAEDDVYYAHQMSKVHDPKNSKAYVDAHKKEGDMMKLTDLLKDAAKTYELRKKTDPNLKYEDVVRGTSLQGIKNFFTREGRLQVVAGVAEAAKTMQIKEIALEHQEEQYIQQYDEETRMTPYDEWKKQWNLERMVNAEVVDPDDPVTEKMISEDAAKLKKLHFHPDFQADIDMLLKAKRDEEQQHDEDVARMVADAPTPKTLAEMQREGVLGARQLAVDTKLANEKLQNETAHPYHYGPNAKLNPEKEPSYAEIDRQAQVGEDRKLRKVNYKNLMRDAKMLAKTGHKADEVILKDDTEAALNNLPTNDKEQIHLHRSEERYYQMLQTMYGKETMEDIKQGVQANAAKSMKAWDQVKNTVIQGGVGVKYGAEALDSLPTRSSSPELEDPSTSLEGNSGDSQTPLRMDDPADDGMQAMPDDSEDTIKVSMQMQGAEQRPRSGYADEAEDTPDKDPAAEVEAEEREANKEAMQAEGDPGRMPPGGPTESAADGIVSNAALQEKKVEEDSDTRKAAAETDGTDMPTVQPKPGDTAQDKEAMKEINAGMQGKAVSNAHEYSGSQQITDSGTPA